MPRPEPPSLEAQLDALLTGRRLGRREPLALAGTTSLAAFLSACGIKGTPQYTLEQLKQRALKVNHPKVPIGNWTWSNWPLYMDKKILKQFDKTYGGHVKYVEEINENNDFYGKVRPQLAAGVPIGRDMVVLTDPMALIWVRAGYCEPIDSRNIPNCRKNLVDNLRNPPWDPGRLYSMPYQSGVVGIGYDIKQTKRELKSLKEFFNPEWKGRVTMLGDAQDCLSMVLIMDGKNPTTAPISEYMAAADQLEKANKAGQFRRFTGNDYSTDLTKGNIAIAMAWAGDLVQLNSDNPNLRFAYGEEGSVYWTDNMLLPRHCEHPYAAETMMNFLYEPEVAAQLTEYVNYFSPVKGVKEILLKKDPDIANNPLIFPPPEAQKGFFLYKALTPIERQKIERRMAQVISGS